MSLKKGRKKEGNSAVKIFFLMNSLIQLWLYSLNVSKIVEKQIFFTELLFVSSSILSLFGLGQLINLLCTLNISFTDYWK